MIKILRFLVRLLYGYRAFGEEVLRTRGPVLLLPNHVSWWDWLLVGVCLEDDWRFVTSRTTSELSWVHRKIMVNKRTFPVDVNSPYAVKHIAEYLQQGGRLVLFPEGRISYTGSLMKLFDGTGFLILKTGAKVITAYIRNGKRLPYSRNPDKKRCFPRISVHFSAVLPVPKCEHLSTTEARTRLTNWLRDRMLEQQFRTEMEFGPATLPAAILETAHEHCGKVILQDATLRKVTYRKLFTGANLLARCWEQLIPASNERVGVLLPNVNALPTTIISLWAAGKVPAVMNYTTGPGIMVACARVAGLKQVITSRVFVKRGRLDLAPLEKAGVQLIYLEDVGATIGGAQKLLMLFSQFPSPWLRIRGQGIDRKEPISGIEKPPARARGTEPAVVLFTSGSEGDPKAVELSHTNLLANIRQMLSVIDLVERDRFFNALPLFHSFGLTVGLFLPLIRGVFTFLYVSPLHYRLVPAAFYDLNCTVFFSTNTFLSGYARKAHPYDFRTLRYLFAGAEKIQDTTMQTWMRKYGVRVLEGYGATECSPCIAVNTPMRSRPGTAGQFFPGIEYRLEPVQGVPEGGRLFVRGPNVMRGYLNPEPNAKFQELGGWYDTGDIVKVDDEGFVHILGRLKRFAKVSGEMVSLTAIEDALAGAFPQFGLRLALAVVALPDESKGEKLIAVSNEQRLNLAEVRDVIKRKGLGNLAMPKDLLFMKEIPKLGTGKVNHRELQRIVEAGLQPAAEVSA